MTALAWFWMEEVPIATRVTNRKGNEPAWLQRPPQPATESADKRCLPPDYYTTSDSRDARESAEEAPAGTKAHGAEPGRPKARVRLHGGSPFMQHQPRVPSGVSAVESTGSTGCHRGTPRAPQSPGRTLPFSFLPPSNTPVSPKKKK